MYATALAARAADAKQKTTDAADAHLDGLGAVRLLQDVAAPKLFAVADDRELHTTLRACVLVVNADERVESFVRASDLELYLRVRRHADAALVGLAFDGESLAGERAVEFGLTPARSQSQRFEFCEREFLRQQLSQSELQLRSLRAQSPVLPDRPHLRRVARFAVEAAQREHLRRRRAYQFAVQRNLITDGGLVLRLPTEVDAARARALGPKLLRLAHGESVSCGGRERDFPTHLRRPRRSELDHSPPLMVRNLHREKAGNGCGARRGALDDEVLAAREDEAKLVRVFADDSASARVRVLRGVVIL